MRAVHHPDAAAPCAAGEPQPYYRISLTLAVHDVRALWSAAVDKGLEDPDLCLADIVEVIGSADDPSIANCIAMLAAPKAWPGCTLDDFWVDAIPAAPLRLQHPA